MNQLIAILTAEKFAGKRTVTLVAFAIAAGLLYLTSDSTSWIYTHIEEVLTALGVGSVATIRMAIANIAKAKA